MAGEHARQTKPSLRADAASGQAGASRGWVPTSPRDTDNTDTAHGVAKCLPPGARPLLLIGGHEPRWVLARATVRGYGSKMAKRV